MPRGPQVALLYGPNGKAVSFADGGSIAGGASGMMVAGKDGSAARFLVADSSGRAVVAGAGTSGSPAGGVLTIQGGAGGTPVSVAADPTQQNATFANTAFGYPVCGTLTPQVWFSCPNGAINSRLAVSRTVGSAPSPSASVTTRLAYVSTAAATSNLASLQTRRALRYIMGIGARWMGAAVFDAGAEAGNTRLVGVGDPSDGFFFGYNGADFGILHRRGGVQEIQTLTVTAGATGAETATVTLDGTAVTVPLVVGSTSATAWQLAQAVYGTAGTGGWDASAIGATVIFVARSARNATGTFSLSSTGAAAGTFAETRQGAAPTDTWITQTNWSEDTVPWLDPTKGNVLGISYQWLGFGEIRFFLEDPDLGAMIEVHRIRYANANTVPSIVSAQRPIYVSSENTTSTSALGVSIGSSAGFCEGDPGMSQSQDWYSENSTTAVTAERSILSLMCLATTNGVVNRGRMRLVMLSGHGESASGNSSWEMKIWRGATYTTPQSFALVSGTNSMAAVSTVISAITTTSAVLLWAGRFARNSTVPPIDLSTLEAIITPGDIITVSVQSAGAVNPDISLGWREEF